MRALDAAMGQVEALYQQVHLSLPDVRVYEF